MYGYIYKFTFLPNGYWYVGKHKYTKKLELDESYWGSGKKWKDLINKYNKSEWPKLIRREIIEWCETKEQLNEREIYLIAELDAVNKGLNISPGGDGGYLGEESIRKGVATRLANGNYTSWSKGATKDTNDSIHKISVALTGKPKSVQAKEKLSIAAKNRLSNKENHPMYGRHWVEGDLGESPLKGKKFSDDHKKKLSKSLKASSHNKGENNPKARSVICIETGRIFSYIREANRWLKETTGHGGHISECCNGKRESAGGYHWKYLE